MRIEAQVTVQVVEPVTLDGKKQLSVLAINGSVSIDFHVPADSGVTLKRGDRLPVTIELPDPVPAAEPKPDPTAQAQAPLPDATASDTRRRAPAAQTAQPKGGEDS